MSENNSASTMMVAIVAILVIIAIGFIVLRVIPGAGDTGGSDINVEVPDLNPAE
jgi:hypothetical protein